MTNTLLVFMDVAGEMRRVGAAFFTRRRQSLSTTFTYEPGYLTDRRSFAIDPAVRRRSAVLSSRKRSRKAS